MARAPFTYPFCYTPAPDIVDAARRLISYLDSLDSVQPNGDYLDLPDGSRGLENRSHPWLRKWEGPADAVSGRDERVARSFPGPCSRPDDKGIGSFDSPGGNLQLRLLKEGKMLGVMKVEDVEGTEEYLYAFSGTVGGRATLPGFVPPIFDLTAPEGYFRQREAEISAMPPGEARKAASAELQAWIFDQYRVSNARGQTLTIHEVFAPASCRRAGRATALRRSFCNTPIPTDLRPSPWANSGTAPPPPPRSANKAASTPPAQANAARS